MKKRIFGDRFSLRLYGDILKKAKCKGYKFVKLADYKDWIDTCPKFIVLRHDIDTSPLNALEMAELEASLGITSTYCIMTRSLFYNPAAPPFFDALRKIIYMGNEIGLHYDGKFYRDRKIEFSKGIAADIKFLESVLGIKIKTVSHHKPFMRGYVPKLPSRYIDAYSPKLLSKSTYISDSGFKWRGTPLFELIGKSSKIYALIHPTTWAYAGLGMKQTYIKCSRIAEGLVQKEFSDFIESTEEYLRTRMKSEERSRKENR